MTVKLWGLFAVIGINLALLFLRDWLECARLTALEPKPVRGTIRTGERK